MNKNEIKKELKNILTNYNNISVIHYSCESFSDRKESYSPRISSICIKHLYTEQVYSFSIHKEAEIKKINKTNIINSYDDLESSMLIKFFQHLRDSSAKIFIHWNMSSSNYGFEAIYHRAEVLGLQPYKVPYGNTIPLASMLIELYGSQYASHPRLENIAKINNVSIQDFLAGEEEARMFSLQEYNRIQMSTSRKTEIIGTILEKTMNSKLKTNTSIYKIFIEEVLSHWVYQLCSIILAIWGIIAIIIEIKKM